MWAKYFFLSSFIFEQMKYQKASLIRASKCWKSISLTNSSLAPLSSARNVTDEVMSLCVLMVNVGVIKLTYFDGSELDLGRQGGVRVVIVRWRFGFFHVEVSSLLLPFAFLR